MVLNLKEDISPLCFLQQQMYAEPILERLDPGRLIQYRLTRDATRYIDGKHMRDLSKLNRDLSKVLILTTDPDTTSLQKENTVVVSRITCNPIQK